MIVVGVTNEPSGRAALGWGVMAARRVHCPLRLVHVAVPPPRSLIPHPQHADELLQGLRQLLGTAESELEKAIASTGDLSDLEVQLRPLAHSDAAVALVEAAVGGVLVIGGEDRRFGGVEVGSVGRLVLRRSQSPIVLVTPSMLEGVTRPAQRQPDAVGASAARSDVTAASAGVRSRRPTTSRGSGTGRTEPPRSR